MSAILEKYTWSIDPNERLRYACESQPSTHLNHSSLAIFSPKKISNAIGIPQHLRPSENKPPIRGCTLHFTYQKKSLNVTGITYSTCVDPKTRRSFGGARCIPLAPGRIMKSSTNPRGVVPEPAAFGENRVSSTGAPWILRFGQMRPHTRRPRPPLLPSIDGCWSECLRSNLPRGAAGGGPKARRQLSARRWCSRGGLTN